MAFHKWIRRLLPTRRLRRRRTLAAPRTDRLECRTLLSAIVVTTPVDLPDATIGDGTAADTNGQTSLRAALQETNALPGPDTIILPPGLFSLLTYDAPGTAATANPSGGPLTVSDDVTLIGAGSTATQIDGGTLATVFDVRNGASLNLGWLTIRSAQQTSAVVTSGEFIEIADVVRDSVVHFPVDNSPGESPTDLSDALPISDLNANRVRLALNPTVKPGYNDQFALSLNRLSARSPARPLLIPSQTMVFPALPPLDAMLGITNPPADAPQTTIRIDTARTPRIAQSGDDGSTGKKVGAELEPENVVNSLFEADSEKTETAVRPAAATDSSSDTRISEPAPEQASPGIDEPQPLFPELDVPPVETELPLIPGVAPLLPDLEAELPEIQVEESAAIPQRGAFLPFAVTGLLSAAFRFRPSEQRKRNQDESRFNSKWATRVEALA